MQNDSFLDGRQTRSHELSEHTRHNPSLTEEGYQSPWPCLENSRDLLVLDVRSNPLCGVDQINMINGFCIFRDITNIIFSPPAKKEEEEGEEEEEEEEEEEGEGGGRGGGGGGGGEGEKEETLTISNY